MYSSQMLSSTIHHNIRLNKTYDPSKYITIGYSSDIPQITLGVQKLHECIIKDHQHQLSSMEKSSMPVVQG